MSLEVVTELSSPGSVGNEDPYEYEVVVDNIAFTIVDGESIEFKDPFEDVYVSDIFGDGEDVYIIWKTTIEELVVDRIWELFDSGELSSGIEYTGILSGNVLVYVLDLPRMSCGHWFEGEIEVNMNSRDTWNFMYFEE